MAATPQPAKVREKAPSRPSIDPRVRKEKQRARAAEKAERRKARAAAADAKQKKPRRRDEGSSSRPRIEDVPSEPRLARDQDGDAVVERAEKRAAPARRAAAAAAPKRGTPKAVIGVLAVLLLAGALALVLAQR